MFKNCVQQRLITEVEDLKKEKNGDGITAEPLDDEKSVWKGTINGPENTPFQDGKFIVQIELTDRYPWHRPKVMFATKVWHPNVNSQTGDINLDIFGKEWKPVMTIRTVLINLRALLAVPQLRHPRDDFAAKQYETNYQQWKANAKAWTAKYASESSDTLAHAHVQDPIPQSTSRAAALVAREPRTAPSRASETHSKPVYTIRFRKSRTFHFKKTRLSTVLEALYENENENEWLLDNKILPQPVPDIQSDGTCDGIEIDSETSYEECVSDDEPNRLSDDESDRLADDKSDRPSDDENGRLSDHENSRTYSSVEIESDATLDGYSADTDN